MTRRAFLLIGVPAVLVSAGLAAFVVRKYSSLVAWLTEGGRSPESRLASHFAYLRLDPEGVRQFLLDYDRHLGPLPRFAPWPGAVYTRYLLSTDFFRHDADESRDIHYVGFYHPHVTPCNNPLARFGEIARG